MTKFETTLAILGFGGSFVAAILFLAFSWTTVRKLKKKPETKDGLGFEYVSGWNILNAAQALSIPRFITKKFKSTALSFLYADADLLYHHTNKFDKLLARFFYLVYITAGLSLILLVILKSTGFFE